MDPGRQLCWMNLEDDATGTTLWQLHDEETIGAAADGFGAWVEKYGVPHVLYTGGKNVYRREPGEAERPVCPERSRRADVREAGDAVFRREEERTIRQDWGVRYAGRFLQIERESRYAPAGCKFSGGAGR